MMELRNRIDREEFDYVALMNALQDYASPHDKVTSLLQDEVVVRVKKGLYVFGDLYRRRPFSRELLANLIYGPSMISLDYALAYHGLIPERVSHLTSVTTAKPKRFDTPVGVFVYRPTPLASFHLGMTRVEQGEVAFLIASAERAVADKVREDRNAPIRSQLDAQRYLFDDLRLDRERAAQLDVQALEELATNLGSRKVLYCAQVLAELEAS